MMKTPVPAPRKPRNWRRWLICVIAIYVVSYVPNSYCGGYWLLPEPPVEMQDYLHGGGPCYLYWQPAVGYRGIYWGTSDAIGLFYSPLITVDRMWFHRTLNCDDPMHEWRLNHFRESEIHPRWRNDAAQRGWRRGDADRPWRMQYKVEKDGYLRFDGIELKQEYRDAPESSDSESKDAADDVGEDANFELEEFAE